MKKINQENAIEVVDVTKSFKIYYDKALKDINVTIKKGETIGLVGVNGSGKSTLLKLMTKIIYPTKGKILTHGKLTSLLELGAGFHNDFTGRENIYFNAAIFGLTKTEIDARINEIIAFSELGEFIDNPVRTYSSGMYMRLAFSIAINVDAEILLIDEILAVGELKESDKTIVIVSHDLGHIENLCTRAIWINEGKIEMDDKPKKVIEEYLKKCR